MKSTILTNWIAPTRKMIRRSEAMTGSAAPGAALISLRLSFALAQGAELFERRAAQVRIAAPLVTDRRGGRVTVVVARVDARLLGQQQQALQAAPHGRRVAALEVGAAAAAHEHD